MLKFAHITDLHLTGTGEPYQGYDTRAATSRALAHMLHMFPDIDFLAITGDLANWGELGAYRRLEAMLADFPVPVFLMVGNHDSRANFLDVFGERYGLEGPYVQYARDVKGWRLIFIDTQAAGTHGGELTPDRLEWIEQRLAEAELPVLLFMHHHPAPAGAPSFDGKGLADWAGLHELLSRYKNRIRHIFHGHCHALLQGNVEGVSFTGLRSMGPQAFTNLRNGHATRWFVEPSYAVALVRENSVVTHIQEFNYSGPLLVNEPQPFSHFARLCADRGVAMPEAAPSVAEAAR
ncbi:MAG TPA: phosphodiesterase [Devosia sp.]|nr:phosphodiesterase [Devosia sp.]